MEVPQQARPQGIPPHVAREQVPQILDRAGQAHVEMYLRGAGVVGLTGAEERLECASAVSAKQHAGDLQCLGGRRVTRERIHGNFDNFMSRLSQRVGRQPQTPCNRGTRPYDAICAHQTDSKLFTTRTCARGRVVELLTPRDRVDRVIHLPGLHLYKRPREVCEVVQRAGHGTEDARNPLLARHARVHADFGPSPRAAPQRVDARPRRRGTHTARDVRAYAYSRTVQRQQCSFSARASARRVTGIVRVPSHAPEIIRALEGQQCDGQRRLDVWNRAGALEKFDHDPILAARLEHVS